MSLSRLSNGCKCLKWSKDWTWLIFRRIGICEVQCMHGVIEMRHGGPRCRSRNRGVIIKPRNGGKVRLWFDVCSQLKLGSLPVWICVNLCDVVYVDVSFFLCTFLSFRHCMVNAAEGHCMANALHKDVCWNVVAWLEHILEPSGKIRSTLAAQRRSASSWLHHRHAAMAMRWRWETIF